MKARILIADDHEVLREGLKAFLTKFRPNLEICGEATTGEQAIRCVQELDPDLVILDITMPGMSGLEACSRMRKMKLDVPVLIFTTHDFERLGTEVQQAGAQGYVLKSEAAQNLVTAIDAILDGGSFFGTPGPQKTLPSERNKSKSKPGGSFFWDFAPALQFVRPTLGWNFTERLLPQFQF
jgi:DNA-binding NarL/FixJ family response regulator